MFINYVLHLLHKQNISRDLILLLIIGGLYSLGLFLSNTFVNVYLWRQTSDYITIATYNLAIVTLQPITCLLAGKLAKKVDRIIVLRLGVIFLALFFLVVLMLQNAAATFNILLGSMLGIGYGFYWLAFNVLTFEITEPETRDIFNGFLGGLESLGGMTGPIIAGSIIAKLDSNIGYITIFTISFSLFLLAVICSFFLKRRGTDGVFDVLSVIKHVKQNINWKYVLYANLFQGMREGLFVFVISIWIFITTGSEFALGMFNLLLNGFSFLFYMLVTKFVPIYQRKNAIFIGSMIISFAVWIIILDLTYSRLLIYATVVGIAYPILNVPFQSMAYDVIGKSYAAKRLRIEYIVLLEVVVNIGRFFSIGIFILVLQLVQSIDPIPMLLSFFSLSYLMIYYWMSKIIITEKMTI